MGNIVVVEIERKLVTKFIETKIREKSKFFEIFADKIIAILFENKITDMELYDIVGNRNAMIEMYKLNHFAKSRLMSNFESDRPELTLTLMGCGEDSKLLKIWVKDVKRKI